ncbi:GNAT family N-acetyltransferase [Patescibacteria group bacterium]
MEVKFRTAGLGDIKDLQTLKYDLWKYEDDNFCDITDPNYAKTDKYAEDLKKQIEDPGFAIIVAEYEDEIIGAVYGEVFEATKYKRIKIDSELMSLYVKEEHRNKKIGAKLVDEFTKWAKSKNADQIKVEPYYNNEGSLRFYEREGFEGYVVMLRKKLK